MDRTLNWSEAFALGHPELDADHRALIQAVNTICAAYEAKREPEELRQLLSELEKLTKDHFDRENRVLSEIIARPEIHLQAAQGISAAVLHEHMEEHQRTLARLQFITRATQPSTRSAGKLLSEELVTWFLEHAVKHDAHLKAVFQAM